LALTIFSVFELEAIPRLFDDATEGGLQVTLVWETPPRGEKLLWLRKIQRAKPSQAKRHVLANGDKVEKTLLFVVKIDK